MNSPHFPRDGSGKSTRSFRSRITLLGEIIYRTAIAVLLAAWFVLRADIGFGQQFSAIRSADTSSPRATLRTLIDSCNEIDQLVRKDRHFDRFSLRHRPLSRRALACLDVSGIPQYEREQVAAEAALCLKETLDRVELPPEKEIPGKDAIQDAGGPEKLSRWQVPGTPIAIALMEKGPRRHEYLFTSDTVRRAPEYYAEVRSLPYRTKGPDVSKGLYEWYRFTPGHPAVGAVVERLPNWARNEIFGQAIWKWAGLLITLLAAVVLMSATYRLYRSLSLRYRERGFAIRYCLTILCPIAAVLIPWIAEHVVYRYLTLRSTLLYVVMFTADLIVLLASLVVVFGLGSRIAYAIIASPKINPEGLNAAVIRIVSKLMSLVACVIVFLEGGRHLGFPVTSLLAATGVGGLAVALAAQDTLKTIFGTIMLMADKPFRVGERIIFEKYDGVVEDIGLRSTKIRLLTGHQVTVPNDELARIDIENVGRRPHIRRVTDIHIPLNTPREKLENAVSIVRDAFDNHKGMDPEFPPRVYFNDFNPDSFNIRVICWYTPPLYWDFLEFSEKVNLEIVRAFEEQGIHFLLPFRITHTSLDGKENPIEVNLPG